MTPTDLQARNRYFTIMAVNIAAVAGAVLGLVILGRSNTIGPTVLGGALVLAALYMMAVVPRALARKWKTPEQP